ncbi:hypothetical protein FQN54_001857 [Arachnomyces sp. PD_36]|nr:hypothetical protein FQN54_001857 [Arachnomyces sp. PD_36]
MSDGAVRKRGRPKKVVVEAAINGDGSSNGTQATATPDSSTSSSKTVTSKKKLSESTKKVSTATKSSKLKAADEPESSTTTTKKRKNTKKSISEEPLPGDQDSMEAAKKDVVETSTKVKRKKAEPRIKGSGSIASTSSSTASESPTVEVVDEATEAKTRVTKSGLTKASSTSTTPKAKVQKEIENDAITSTTTVKAAAYNTQSSEPSSLKPETQQGSQLPNPGAEASASKTSTPSNQTGSSVPSSKILDALASEKTTSDFGKSKSISSQKQAISKPLKPLQPATSTLNTPSASKPLPTNPVPPQRKVLDAQALSELKQRGTGGPKVADVRATQQYKNAARKWTSTIVALPILLYTSYEIYQRGILGKERKRLSLAEGYEEPVIPASPTETPKSEGPSQPSL